MDENTQTQQTTTVSNEAPVQVTKTTTTVAPPAVKMEHPQKVYESRKAIFRTYQIIWYVLGVIEVLLGFRMFLNVLGANPASGFASLIYAISNPLALPFRGIFGITVVPGEPAVFEWSTLVAMVVYFLIAYGLVELMQIVKPVTPSEISESVDKN